MALARAEQKAGLSISDEQIESMEKHIDAIDFDRVDEIETNIQHDVMAHLHAFAEQCPSAKGIIHLGATSAYLTDNTDLIQMRLGLQLLIKKGVKLLEVLASLAEKNADVPCVGYTHFQPAQPTTVGKRICLWLQDFFIDIEGLQAQIDNLYFLGLKGATGTQSSFMILFDHDEKKVEQLDEFIAEEMGFEKVFEIAGQTYTRKQDVQILHKLSGLAASAHKCGTDLRLLSHTQEMKEGKGKKQVGSSAMPHKQNPIYSERICSLSRLLISFCQNGSYTLATQWLERSLDDSAGRRIYIPESFLTADAILDLLIKVFSQIIIDEKMIGQNLKKYEPELFLENILMRAVLKGKDRQEIHEILRQDPNFIEALGLSANELASCKKIEVGRAKSQVISFLNNSVFPLLRKS